MLNIPIVWSQMWLNPLLDHALWWVFNIRRKGLFLLIWEIMMKRPIGFWIAIKMSKKCVCIYNNNNRLYMLQLSLFWFPTCLSLIFTDAKGHSSGWLRAEVFHVQTCIYSKHDDIPLSKLASLWNISIFNGSVLPAQAPKHRQLLNIETSQAARFICQEVNK